MTTFQAIILGIIQGITEFLPISSSGHLVLAPHLLNWDIPTDQIFVFDVLVQMGTLVAVIIYFWKDLFSIFSGAIKNISKPDKFKDPHLRLATYIILATIPAGLIGLIFKDQIEGTFGDPLITAALLFVTAILLFLAEKIGKQNREIKDIAFWQIITIGLFQALALFPGMSRSGATISSGMFIHLKRPAAARFSFLISVPIMAAAGLYASLGLFEIANLSNFIAPMVIGFITSAIVGYFAIRWLIKFLSTYPLYYFSIYLILLSILIFIIN